MVFLLRAGGRMSLRFGARISQATIPVDKRLPEAATAYLEQPPWGTVRPQLGLNTGTTVSSAKIRVEAHLTGIPTLAEYLTRKGSLPVAMILRVSSPTERRKCSAKRTHCNFLLAAIECCFRVSLLASACVG